MHTWKRPLPAAVLYAVLLAVSAGTLSTGFFFPWGVLTLGGAALSALVLFTPAPAHRRPAGTGHLARLAGPGQFRAASERSLDQGSAVLLISLTGIRDSDPARVAFAELLRGCVPAAGLVARLGGDEFAVLLTAPAHPAAVYDVAGLIAGATAPILIGGRLVDLTAAIGVAVSGPGELTHEELMRRAGLAMERAERNGPQTRWAVWQDYLDEETHHLAA